MGGGYLGLGAKRVTRRVFARERRGVVWGRHLTCSRSFPRAGAWANRVRRVEKRRELIGATTHAFMSTSNAGVVRHRPHFFFFFWCSSHSPTHSPHFACSEELQKAAVDADAVRHLAHLLAQQQQQQQPSTATPRPSRAPTPSASLPNDAPGAAAGSGGPSEGAAKAAVAAGSGGSGAGEGAGASGGGSAALQEGVLRALGNMCLTWNDGRKQLIEAKVRSSVGGEVGCCTDVSCLVGQGRMTGELSAAAII